MLEGERFLFCARCAKIVCTTIFFWYRVNAKGQNLFFGRLALAIFFKCDKQSVFEKRSLEAPIEKWSCRAAMSVLIGILILHD